MDPTKPCTVDFVQLVAQNSKENKYPLVINLRDEAEFVEVGQRLMQLSEHNPLINPFLDLIMLPLGDRVFYERYSLANAPSSEVPEELFKRGDFFKNLSALARYEAYRDYHAIAIVRQSRIVPDYSRDILQRILGISAMAGIDLNVGGVTNSTKYFNYYCYNLKQILGRLKK
jgi:hypothetical protein